MFLFNAHQQPLQHCIYAIPPLSVLKMQYVIPEYTVIFMYLAEMNILLLCFYYQLWVHGHNSNYSPLYVYVSHPLSPLQALKSHTVPTAALTSLAMNASQISASVSTSTSSGGTSGSHSQSPVSLILILEQVRFVYRYSPKYWFFK